MESEKIYKFYGYRDFDLDAFAGSYLWCSKVKDFNDPFEGLYREQIKSRKVEDISDQDVILFYKAIALNEGLSEEGANNKAISLFADRLDELDTHKSRIVDSLNRTILKTLDKMENRRFFCCFARDHKDKPALSNKLMWSHYANGLRGFVLEFESDNLGTALNTHNDFEIQGDSIIYGEMDAIDDLEAMTEALKGKDNSGVVRVLFTKSPEWEYEQELRVISEASKVYYKPPSIKSIILGQKMPKEKLNTLMAVIRSLGLTDKVKVATIDKKTFNLSIVDFNKDLFE